MRRAINISFILLLGVFLILNLNTVATAQVKEGIRIHVVQGSVFVYHNKMDVYAFNVYRDGDKVNDQPITGLIYPEELPQVLGEDYQPLANMLQAESPSSVFFKLKANKAVGRLATFLYPEVAKALGNLFIDNIATNGQSVNYKVEFINDLGKPTGEVFETQATLDVNRLVSPSNLEANNKKETITLYWDFPKTDEDDNVIQFHVYRTSFNGHERVGHNELVVRNNAQERHKITFEADEIGVTQTYVVHAVDISGRESSPSEEISYTVRDQEAPAAVGGVTAKASSKYITVSWNTSTETDLAGYYVYRSPRMRDGYKRITDAVLDPLNTYFVDSTMIVGHNFSYKISAIDLSENESEHSLAAMARISDKTAPDAVTNLQAAYTEPTVEISWSPLKDGQSYRSYIVLRKQINAGNKAFTRLNDSDLRNAQWSDKGRSGKGFLEGALYEYVVIATDSARNFSDSASFVLQIPDVTAPEPPGSIQAHNEDGLSVSLRWNASTSADTEAYNIYRSTGDSSSRVINRVSRQQRSYEDKEVVKGMSYVYAVSTVDSLENESESIVAEIVKVRDFDPPRSVRNVMVMLEENEIRWEPVVAYDLAGYNIYQANIATGKFEKINEQAVQGTNWKGEGLKKGMWYRVRSIDISGNESKPSEPKQAK